MDKQKGRAEKIGSVLLIVLFIGIMVWGVKEILNTGSPRPEVVHIQVESLEIAVVSQAVKLVDGKYRYFLDIRNQDDQPFSGSVEIELIGAEGNRIYEDTFTTNQPIQPGVGTSQYVEASTGPVSVHGQNGVVSFRYTATSNGSVVKTGEGAISTTLESY